ncbi:MAG: PhzF family phenazine biosynthesis protein [Acidimicrobiia bacterium]
MKFFLYDVFTSKKFSGGPLAVVDCRNLDVLPSDDLMQKIAREFSLPETTFIFEPENTAHEAQIRFFTMTHELPMAGHPTVGTSLHLYNEKQEKPENFIVELGVGPTRIEFEDNKAFMFQQPCKKYDASKIDKELLAKNLGIEKSTFDDDYPIEFFSAGLTFLIVPMMNKDSLNRIIPAQNDLHKMFEGFPAHHIYAFSFDKNETVVNTRMFIGDPGDMVEDPSTGSAAGSLSHYLYEYKRSFIDGKNLTIHQGEKMGRPSEIYISLENNQFGDLVPRVGGSSVLLASGELF